MTEDEYNAAVTEALASADSFIEGHIGAMRLVIEQGDPPWTTPELAHRFRLLAEHQFEGYQGEENVAASLLSMWLATAMQRLILGLS